jgi:ATP-dependent helicase/nuclease subunit A
VISSDKKGRQRYDAWSEEEYGGRRAAYQAGSFMDWLGPAVIGGRDNTPWVSKLWTADQVFVPLEKKREDNELWQAVLTMTEPDNEESEWGFIGRRLEWRYARKRAGELNAKLSVTQAKGRLYPDEDTGAAKALYVETKEIYAPRMEGPRYLAGDQSLTPGERGTLLHKVLARIEPYETRRAMDERKEQGMGDRAAVEACLDDLLRRLTTDEFITPAEEEQVDKERLIPFLLSELFQRIASADARGECRREASFFMAVPAGRVYAELSEGSSDPGGLASGFEEDEVIVQGTVDVFFVEGDGLVLADYKSDRIEPGGEAELLRRYRGQLLLYAEGLEAFTGRKVTEMLLYSLALGKEIPLNPITG